MIINDDVSFGFTITNLLDDLTKIIILNEMEHNFTEFPIMYHGDGEIDTSLLISMPLINGGRRHRLCQRSHRRHRDTKNGLRHQMNAMKNFCFYKT